MDVVTYLLRRISADINAAHYRDDEVNTRQIPEASWLAPKGSVELTAATVSGLTLTVSHKWEIGTPYPQVPETPVHGACRELFD